MHKGKIGRCLVVISALSVSVLLLVACEQKAEIPKDYDYGDLSEYIDLGDYKDLGLTAEAPQVSADEVNAYIQNELKAKSAKHEVTKGTVAEDSVVKADYIGRLNGKKFDGGTGNDVEIDIANNNFIDGFAKGLVGHSVGDKFDLSLRFPDNYGAKELAGKDVVFTMTVKSLVVSETPAYDDTFIKTQTKFKNKADYEKHIRESILARKKKELLQSEKKDLFAKIVASSTVKKYPKKELDEKYGSMVDSYKKLAKQNDADYDEYIKRTQGVSVKDFEAHLKDLARTSVKQELVICSIAKKEDITVSQEEYDAFLKRILKESGYTKDTYKEATGMTIEEYAKQNDLYYALMYDKVMDRVIKLNTAK